MIINLTDLKVALFDFDDTLCIHTERPRSKALPDFQYSADVFAGRNPWRGGVAPKVMQQFVKLCEDKGIILGLISGTSTYMRSCAKIAWVKEHYGVSMQNFCVASQEVKLQMMHDVCVHYGARPHQLLFVDDVYDNLEAISGAGFTACSPMEVVYFMERYNTESLRREVPTNG